MGVEQLAKLLRNQTVDLVNLQRVSGNATIFHSLGRERGEDMGKLHTQGHGATLGPAIKAGCTALSQKYKEDMNIVTHSRRKVQFKLMEAGQPD